MTNQELEEQLDKVNKKIITEIQLGHVRGLDNSWHGKTYRWGLKSLQRALLDLLEYQRHEHHNLKSFSRSKKS